MTIQEFGVGAEGRRVLGRRFHRLFQALQCLKSVAFAFQLPDFAGGILRGNSPCGKAKANHNPREPHRYSLLHPSLQTPKPEGIWISTLSLKITACAGGRRSADLFTGILHMDAAKGKVFQVYFLKWAVG